MYDDITIDEEEEEQEEEEEEEDGEARVINNNNMPRLLKLVSMLGIILNNIITNIHIH